jgi:DNA polymerase III delta subunit
MVGIGREEQAWAIQEALLSGNPTVALTKLRELLVISEVPEQVIVWSMVDLVRKIHDCSRLLTQGEPEFAVTKAVKLWGPTQAPILRIARRLTPTTATRLLEAAIGLDLGVRRGTTRDFARRLQGFSVELTDSFAR